MGSNTLTADGTVTNSTWSLSGSATLHDAVVASGGGYAFRASASAADTAEVSVTSFTLPAGALVKRVIGYAISRKQAGGSFPPAPFTLSIHKGATQLATASGDQFDETFTQVAYLPIYLGALTQAEIDDLRVRYVVPDDGGVGLQPHYLDHLRILVEWAALPTTTVPTPASGNYVTNLTPQVAWSPTFDSIGGDQTGWEAKLFTIAQYSIGGFDPATSPNTISVSGTTELNYTPSALVNGEDYRWYVRVKQTINATAHWSVWTASNNFRIHNTINSSGTGSVAAMGLTAQVASATDLARVRYSPPYSTLISSNSSQSKLNWIVSGVTANLRIQTSLDGVIYTDVPTSGSSVPGLAALADTEDFPEFIYVRQIFSTGGGAAVLEELSLTAGEDLLIDECSVEWSYQLEDPFNPTAQKSEVRRTGQLRTKGVLPNWFDVYNFYFVPFVELAYEAPELVIQVDYKDVTTATVSVDLSAVEKQVGDVVLIHVAGRTETASVRRLKYLLPTLTDSQDVAGTSKSFADLYVLPVQPANPTHPSVASVGTDFGTSAASVTPTLPFGSAAGDLVLYYMTQDSTGSMFISSGWSLIYTNFSSAHRVDVIARVLDGVTGVNVPTFTGQTEDYVLHGVRFAKGDHGVNNTASDIAITSATGASGNIDPPSATASASRVHTWLAYGSIDATSTGPADAITVMPSGFTEVVNTLSASSTTSVRAAIGIQKPAAGTTNNPGTFTNSSRPWIAVTVAIPPFLGVGENQDTLLLEIMERHASFGGFDLMVQVWRDVDPTSPLTVSYSQVQGGGRRIDVAPGAPRGSIQQVWSSTPIAGATQFVASLTGPSLYAMRTVFTNASANHYVGAGLYCPTLVSPRYVYAGSFSTSGVYPNSGVNELGDFWVPAYGTSGTLPDAQAWSHAAGSVIYGLGTLNQFKVVNAADVNIDLTDISQRPDALEPRLEGLDLHHAPFSVVNTSADFVGFSYALKPLLATPRWMRFDLGVLYNSLPVVEDTGTILSTSFQLGDFSYRLATREIFNPLSIPVSTDVGTYIKDTLNTVFGVATVGYTAPIGVVTTRVLTFEDPQTSWLVVFNTLLEEIGWSSLWVTSQGAVKIEPADTIDSKVSEWLYQPGSPMIAASSVENLLQETPNQIRFVASPGGPTLPVEGNGYVTRTNIDIGPASVNERNQTVASTIPVAVNSQDALERVANAEANRIFAGGGIAMQLKVALNPLFDDRDVITIEKPRIAVTGLEEFMVTNWRIDLKSEMDESVALMNVKAVQRFVWTPAQIDSALRGAWYDTSDLNTLTIATNLCTQMNDKSGNAKHVVATGSDCPGALTRTANLRHCLDFTGSDFMRYIGSSGIDVDNCTIFVVIEQDSDASFDGLVSLHSAGSDHNTTDAMVVVSGGAGVYTQIERNNVNSSVAGTGAAPLAVYTFTSLVGVMTAYMNGVVGTPTSSAAAGTVATGGILLGGRFQGGAVSGSNKFDGRWCEAYVHKAGNPTAILRTQIERYMGTRWRVPAYLL